MLTLKSLSGNALKDLIPDIARLRIEVFRAYPYLYDGDMEYETGYLQTYIKSPGSIIVLALDDRKIVGASTAIPLAHETEYVQRPFLSKRHDLSTIFYCGESVLLPAYRGRGAGVQFFTQREAHAQRLGGFKYSAFCAVQRPDNHPMRPADYTPLDKFWAHRGYQRQPELMTTFSWKEVGENAESEKPMVFWMKTLS